MKESIKAAALEGNIEKVNTLIESHSDISLGIEVLHEAYIGGHASLVRLLVTKYGCDLNA